jgi:hypothetical protein
VPVSAGSSSSSKQLVAIEVAVRANVGAGNREHIEDPVGVVEDLAVDDRRLREVRETRERVATGHLGRLAVAVRRDELARRRDRHEHANAVEFLLRDDRFVGEEPIELVIFDRREQLRGVADDRAFRAGACFGSGARARRRRNRSGFHLACDLFVALGALLADDLVERGLGLCTRDADGLAAFLQLAATAAPLDGHRIRACVFDDLRVV